jgi:hypothetical protein
LRDRRAGVIFDLQNRGIENADHFQIEEVSEGPSGVVVGMLLRIAGGPELAVEQRIGDAGVRLIHADDDAAGGEGLLLRLVSALLGGDGGSGGFGELLDLDVLALHDLEQLDLAIGVGRVGGDHVGGGAFERWLLDGALALGVVVLEEMMRVAARSKRAWRAERFLRSCCCRAATSSRPAAADSAGTRCANILPG